MIRYVIDQQKEVSEHLGHVCGCPMATLGSELAGQHDEVRATINNISDQKSKYYESALRDLKSEGLINRHIDIKKKTDDIFALIIGLLIMARIKNDIAFLENNMRQALFDLLGLKKNTD